MIIRLSEIPAEGIRIDGPEAFPRPFADPTWTLDGVALALEKDADAVFVRGTLEARVPLVCGRCLEPFDLHVSQEVDTRFFPRRRAGRKSASSPPTIWKPTCTPTTSWIWARWWRPRPPWRCP